MKWFFCCLVCLFSIQKLDAQASLLNWKLISERKSYNCKKPDLIEALTELDSTFTIYDPTQFDKYLRLIPHTRFEKMFSFCELLDHCLILEGAPPGIEIKLNGKAILRSQSYFYPQIYTFKENSLKEENVLSVHFEPLSKELEKILKKQGFVYPADSDPNPLKTSVFKRQPAYFSGWDFSPGYPRFGIRSIKLKSISPSLTLDLKGVLKDQQAYLELNIQNPVSEPFSAKFVVSVKDLIDTTIHLECKPGLNSLIFPVPSKKLKRWWPNGYGEPTLYPYQISVEQSKIPAYKEGKVGFRQVRLKQEPDALGKSFYFEINGKAVYCQGFNVIQSEQGFSRQELELWKQAGVNMIRVWGGGDYGSDSLYSWCDEMGIMVWQDLAFANSIYPFHNLKNLIKEETNFQVRRIKHHPSLVLWCGNNEVEVAWKNWGWQLKYQYSKPDSLALITEYQVMQDSLQYWISQVDSSTPFLSSSPISNWGSSIDFTQGDNHFWGVYHGDMPISAYRDHIPRFASEFGMQSYSWPLSSANNKVFNALPLDHPFKQSSYKGINTPKNYVENTLFSEPDSLRFMYKTQVVQALASYEALGAYRSSKPKCMGALIWQYNDVWPGASWSLLDYQKRPKLAWTTLKQCFAKAFVYGYWDGPKLMLSWDINFPPDSMLIKFFNEKGESLRSYHYYPMINEPSTYINCQDLMPEQKSIHALITVYSADQINQLSVYPYPILENKLTEPEIALLKKGDEYFLQWKNRPEFPVMETNGSFWALELPQSEEKELNITNLVDENFPFRVHHLKGVSSWFKPPFQQ